MQHPSMTITVNNNRLLPHRLSVTDLPQPHHHHRTFTPNHHTSTTPNGYSPPVPPASTSQSTTPNPANRTLSTTLPLSRSYSVPANTNLLSQPSSHESSEPNSASISFGPKHNLDVLRAQRSKQFQQFLSEFGLGDVKLVDAHDLPDSHLHLNTEELSTDPDEDEDEEVDITVDSPLVDDPSTLGYPSTPEVHSPNLIQHSPNRRHLIQPPSHSRTPSSRSNDGQSQVTNLNRQAQIKPASPLPYSTDRKTFGSYLVSCSPNWLSSFLHSIFPRRWKLEYKLSAFLLILLGILSGIILFWPPNGMPLFDATRLQSNSAERMNKLNSYSSSATTGSSTRSLLSVLSFDWFGRSRSNRAIRPATKNLLVDPALSVDEYYYVYSDTHDHDAAVQSTYFEPFYHEFDGLGKNGLFGEHDQAHQQHQLWNQHDHVHQKFPPKPDRQWKMKLPTPTIKAAEASSTPATPAVATATASNGKAKPVNLVTKLLLDIDSDPHFPVQLNKIDSLVLDDLPATPPAAAVATPTVTNPPPTPAAPIAKAAPVTSTDPTSNAESLSTTEPSPDTNDEPVTTSSSPPSSVETETVSLEIEFDSFTQRADLHAPVVRKANQQPTN